MGNNPFLRNQELFKELLGLKRYLAPAVSEKTKEVLPQWQRKLVKKYES